MAAPQLDARDPLEPRRSSTATTPTSTINDSLLAHVWRGAGKGWWACFAVALSLLGMLVVAIACTLCKGIGVWGNNIPVGWAFGITNFVWWIGIGHAGTLISAILLLFQQKWRTSINRFAEAMTLFAVICALLFPLLHIGRPWFAVLAAARTRARNGIWPHFKSPLLWDVFAVSTYFTVSLLFWFLGLIPDLATLRDSRRARPQRIVYGMLRARLARLGPPLGRVQVGLPAPGRPLDAAGALGALRSCPSTSPPRSSPAGTRRSSRRTSSPAPSSRASRWCMTLDDPGARASSASSTSSP